MKIALLDGDVIAFRAAAAAQEDIDWNDGLDKPSVSFRAARANALTLAKSWAEKAGCRRALVCFSPKDGSNFRRKLFKYKMERGEKPMAYWAAVESLEDAYDVVRIPMLEADDALGLLSTGPDYKRPIIVSIDKDMRTVPGWLLNPLKDERPRRIVPLEADRFWMRQALTGDPIDGYKGCPGIGPVKADVLLAACHSLGEMWEAVRGAYHSCGLTDDDALLQVRLARILRHGDYNEKDNSICLWTPNKNRPCRLLLD